MSRLGLGTLTWGRDTDEHEARDQLIAFVEAGGTLLDTAAGYGDGASEELIGTLIGDVVARDDVVIATKAGISRAARRARVTNASRGYLLRHPRPVAARGSASTTSTCGRCTPGSTTPRSRRRCPPSTSPSTTGRAAYVGISNYPGWQTATGGDLAARGARAGDAGLHAGRVLPAQPRTSSARCSPPREALGLGVLPWSPLGRGVLTGKYRTGTPSDSRAASPDFASFVGAYLNERVAPDRRGGGHGPPTASAGRRWRWR